MTWLSPNLRNEDQAILVYCVYIASLLEAIYSDSGSWTINLRMFLILTFCLQSIWKTRLIILKIESLKIQKLFQPASLIGINVIGNDSNKTNRFHRSIGILSVASKLGQTFNTILKVGWQDGPIFDNCVTRNWASCCKCELKVY